MSVSASWLLVFVLVGMITTPILWIYGMYDAYKSAEKINCDIARQGDTGRGPATN